MSTELNEMTRVQFPAILHLMGLGYDFISKKKVEKIKDPKNNILLPVLKDRFLKLNLGSTEKDFADEYKEIGIELTNKDLGQEFYDRIQN